MGWGNVDFGELGEMGLTVGCGWGQTIARQMAVGLREGRS